jgi:hypothetical protein
MPPRHNYNSRNRQSMRGQKIQPENFPPSSSRYQTGTDDTRQPIYNTYHSLSKPREKILREI